MVCLFSLFTQLDLVYFMNSVLITGMLKHIKAKEDRLPLGIPKGLKFMEYICRRSYT